MTHSTKMYDQESFDSRVETFSKKPSGDWIQEKAELSERLSTITQFLKKLDLFHYELDQLNDELQRDPTNLSEELKKERERLSEWMIDTRLDLAAMDHAWTMREIADEPEMNEEGDQE